MNKIVSYGLIAIISLFCISPQGIVGISQSKDIIDGFNVLEANIVQSSVYGYGELEDNYLSFKELEKKAIEKFVLFGFEKSSIIELDPNYLGVYDETQIKYPIMRKLELDKYREISIQGENKEGQIVKVVTQAMDFLEDNKRQGKSYITIEVFNTKNHKDLTKTSDFVRQQLDKPVQKGVFCYVSGYYDGFKSISQQKKLIQRVLQELNVRDINMVNDSRYVSATGYSPYLGETVDIGNIQINIQVSTRYSTYEDKTYLWIATPLITIEH